MRVKRSILHNSIKMSFYLSLSFALYERLSFLFYHTKSIFQFFLQKKDIFYRDKFVGSISAFIHDRIQSNSVKYRFLEPPHPPQTNFSHLPAAVLYLNLHKNYFFSYLFFKENLLSFTLGKFPYKTFFHQLRVAGNTQVW